jgi:hypothetical protein
MRLLVFISLCLSLAILSLSAKNAEFSEHRTLPPLKLSAADLDTILRKTQTLVAAANGPASDEESARESVKLGVRGHEIRYLTSLSRAALRSRRKSSSLTTPIGGLISRSHPSRLIWAITHAACR